MNKIRLFLIGFILLSGCSVRTSDHVDYTRKLSERVFENYLKNHDCDLLLSYEDSIDFSVVLESSHCEMFSYCSAMQGNFEKAEKYRQLALSLSKTAHDSIRHLIAEVEILEYANRDESAIDVGRKLLMDKRLEIMDESFLLHKMSELFQTIGKLDSAEYYIRQSLVERFNVSSNRLYKFNQEKLCEILIQRGDSCEVEEPNVLK